MSNRAAMAFDDEMHRAQAALAAMATVQEDSHGAVTIAAGQRAALLSMRKRAMLNTKETFRRISRLQRDISARRGALRAKYSRAILWLRLRLFWRAIRYFVLGLLLIWLAYQAAVWMSRNWAGLLGQFGFSALELQPEAAPTVSATTAQRADAKRLDGFPMNNSGKIG